MVGVASPQFWQLWQCSLPLDPAERDCIAEGAILAICLSQPIQSAPVAARADWIQKLSANSVSLALILTER